MRIHLPHINIKQIALLGLFFILLSLLALSAYYYMKQKQEFEITKAQLTNELAVMENNFTTVVKENGSLYEALFSEQQKNQAFAKQISDIASTVGTLDKLSKTDPELLQKYSKVYFLNEHYRPEKLTLINENLIFKSEKEQYVHTNVWPYLRRMVEDVNEDGLTLRVLSAFRSFDSQVSIKNGYKITYGTGANQFSADQGYSEHQLGTTVDFTTENTGTLLPSFENTDEYKWLTNNAYRYGFILSYPKGNVYYQYEPWHWRFVGVVLATKLHDERGNFYDLDQRDIHPYLINIFD